MGGEDEFGYGPGGAAADPTQSWRFLWSVAHTSLVLKKKKSLVFRRCVKAKDIRFEHHPPPRYYLKFWL